MEDAKGAGAASGARPSQDEDASARGRKYERYWGPSESGAHRVSRPIVMHGLTQPVIRIELAPRIKLVGGELVDDSYRAVERAAAQFYRSFTLEQLVMASVALQVHMRRNKEHLSRKKALQEKWTALAHRMKKLRVEDEHLTFEERRLGERRAALAADSADLAQLLDIQEEEHAQRRAAWRVENDAARSEWVTLEREDAQLLQNAPHFEKTEDLRDPYLLTILAEKPNPLRGGKTRSLASAMHALVEALQKPLSRTDQILLELALRRCVRASTSSAAAEDVAITWEKDLMSRAEGEFVEEFPWAGPYVSGAAAGK